MVSANTPNEPNNPGKRSRNQVNNRASHKNLPGAVPKCKPGKEELSHTVKKTEDGPGRSPGYEHFPGASDKSQNGNRGEQAQDGNGQKVAFECESFEDRDAVC